MIINDGNNYNADIVISIIIMIIIIITIITLFLFARDALRGIASSFRLYIPQRGVQWKQDVVICMLLYTSLLYTTTPIHCTPLPLHPPAMNTRRRVSLAPKGRWQQYAGARPAALWQVAYERPIIFAQKQTFYDCFSW